MNKGVKYTLVIKDFEQYKEGYNITPKYDRDTREFTNDYMLSRLVDFLEMKHYDRHITREKNKEEV